MVTDNVAEGLQRYFEPKPWKQCDVLSGNARILFDRTAENLAEPMGNRVVRGSAESYILERILQLR